MTAFGFKLIFKPKIIAKTKTMTIRKMRKDGRFPPLNGELQLFTGMRTKQAQRFGTATAIEVRRLTIDWPHSWVDIDMGGGQLHRVNCWKPDELDGLEPFARSDGFESWAEMAAMFQAIYGRDALFEGYLTRWGKTFVPDTEDMVRTKWPDGHVVHMSLDHTKTPSDSLAECDCGWVNRVPWLKGRYKEQDAAIEAHWREVESGRKP